MKPHLVRWHETYGPKGLVVIDIDDGTIDRNFGDVLAEFNKRPLPFPVLWDEKAEYHDRYGATDEGTPWTVLIGADGEIAWKGHPLDKLEEIESAIRKELAALPKEE